MKALKKALVGMAIAVISVAVIFSGSLVGVFFAERDKPEDIFILDYAFVEQRNGDGKIEIWFVRKADSKTLANGDGVIYYDGKYDDANVMVSSGTLTFFSADDLNENALVDDENIVGKIIASWKQK